MAFGLILGYDRSDLFLQAENITMSKIFIKLLIKD
jgi:hypothetical protein